MEEKFRCNAATSLWMCSPTAPSAAIRWLWCWMPRACRLRRCRRSPPNSIIPRPRSCCRRRDAANDAQVRIFTVRSEIPFAGHPNVGTAFVLATQASKPPARLKFEEKAGLVPVEILSEQGRVVGAELTAPQPLKRLAQLGAGQAAACLSLSPADIKIRPSCAADRLGRTAVSDGGAGLARGAAAGEAGCGGVRPHVSLRRFAMRSTSIRATCRLTRSHATCRRGCSIRAQAACPRIRPPAARPRPPRRCSPISTLRARAN